jgi:cellulose synthase operon protein C
LNLLWGHPLRILFATVFVTVCCCLVPCVRADDPETRFLAGLRERRYFDTAVEYLDGLSSADSRTAVLFEVRDLEKGITFQQMAGLSRLPEERETLLDQADAAYRKFLKEHPGHKQEAAASFSLGELVLERAKTRIWQAEGSSDSDEKKAHQKAARQRIDEAEKIFQQAFNGYQKQYKAFPPFVDEAADPETFRKRQEAESWYLKASFSLCRCMYERGQTWPPDSDERMQILEKSRSLFDEIYKSRRNNPVGLHARLMMGKCFQEQGDLSNALGIYSEVLSQTSPHPSVRTLKTVALHYRLTCLNIAEKPDHQVVLQEAADWIRNSDNASELSTMAGLGIQWEKAVAEEKLSDDRNVDESQKNILKRQALEDSLMIARYPGPLREPAIAMSRRLKSALGETDKEPKSFNDAFDRAREMIEQIQKLNSAADAEPDATAKKQKLTELDLHLNEVGRLLRLALDLREDDTDAKAVAQAKYLMSFILYRQRKNYDAVIMATHCMTRERTADPETAENASEIAVSAGVQAWNDAPADDREFEVTLLRDTCLKVLELYPNSSRASHARIRLGRIYQQMQNPEEAVRWYQMVPESDEKFAEAQIGAGQTLWAAWTTRMQQSRASGASETTGASSTDAATAELDALKTQAEKHLTTGLKLMREKSGDDEIPSDEVVAAEVSLAGLLNVNGDFPQCISRLTSGGKRSVISLIRVSDSEKRPAAGIRSPSFAALTLRLLLRAYVGTQQIDEALRTMNQLKTIGGQEVTAVYTQLGLELQEELQRLRQAKDTKRLKEVQTSFEQFLAKVYEQRDAKNYNSLLWISETYFGLGQGVSKDPVAASAYYEKAASTYQQILDGKLAPEDTVTAIRLRLARCRRAQNKYAEAFTIVKETLQKTPLAVDAQMEAASVLSDWGSSGQPDRMKEAIQGVRGTEGELVVWGWLNIAKRLQQKLSQDSSPEFLERFLEARYQLSNTRRRAAAGGGPDAEPQLRAALAELAAFTRIDPNISTTWWEKFDRLYQDIQKDLKQTPRPLERMALTGKAGIGDSPAADAAAVSSDIPNGVAGAPSETTAVSEHTAPSTAQQPTSQASTPAIQNPSSGPKTSTGSESALLPVLVGSLGVGLLGGFYFLMRKPRRRTRAAALAVVTREPPSFENIEFRSGAPTLSFPVTPVRTKSTTATTTAKPAPATKKTGAALPEGQPAPARRPAADQRTQGDQPPASADRPRRPRPPKQPPNPPQESV